MSAPIDRRFVPFYFLFFLSMLFLFLFFYLYLFIYFLSFCAVLTLLSLYVCFFLSCGFGHHKGCFPGFNFLAVALIFSQFGLINSLHAHFKLSVLCYYLFASISFYFRKFDCVFVPLFSIYLLLYLSFGCIIECMPFR